MQPRHKKIAGVVGPAASGKNTVADIFVEKGFTHISASDVLRSEIASRGLVTSRQLQTLVANELRLLHGDGYWVERSLAEVDQDASRIVISGLYAVGEGRHVKSLGGVLVGVTVGEQDDTGTRLERLVKRSEGVRDRMSAADFLAANERENNGEGSHEANVSALVKIADFVIENSSTLEALHVRTLAVINEIDRNV